MMAIHVVVEVWPYRYQPGWSAIHHGYCGVTQLLRPFVTRLWAELEASKNDLISADWGMLSFLRFTGQYVRGRLDDLVYVQCEYSSTSMSMRVCVCVCEVHMYFSGWGTISANYFFCAESWSPLVVNSELRTCF